MASEKLSSSGKAETVAGKEAWSGGFSKRNLFRLQMALLVAAFAFPFKTAVVSLVHTWSTRNDYSHGFFVPFVSLYLAWTIRGKWASIEERPNYGWGGAALLAGTFFMVLGRAAGVVVVEELALVWLIAGLILFVLGGRFLMALWFPIAYLLFMVPWIDEVVDRFHWPLQLISADMGVWLLRLFDYPVLQETQFIVLPNIVLEVAEECSGVRFLVSIIAVGVPLVYLTQRKWSYRIGVIAFAMGVAIVANGMRVAMVSMMAYYYGEAAAHGPFHIFHGFLVAQIGFVALFVVNWYLMRRTASRGAKAPLSTEALPRWGTIAQGRFSFPFWAALLFFVLLGTVLKVIDRTPPVPLRAELASFPKQIAGWTGRDSKWIENDAFFPGVDAALARLYRTESGDEVRLYIGYYASQHPGKVLINYLSKEFHQNAVEVPFQTVSSVRIVPKRINHGEARDHEGERLALFWYQLNDRSFTGRYETKGEMIKETLLRNRSNGAIIIFATYLKRPDEQEEKEQLLGEFVKKAIPYLERVLP